MAKRKDLRDLLEQQKREYEDLTAKTLSEYKQKTTHNLSEINERAYTQGQEKIILYERFVSGLVRSSKEGSLYDKLESLSAVLENRRKSGRTTGRRKPSRRKKTIEYEEVKRKVRRGTNFDNLMKKYDVDPGVKQGYRMALTRTGILKKKKKKRK